MSQTKAKANMVSHCIFERNTTSHFRCLRNTSSETSYIPSKMWFLKKVSYIIFPYNEKKIQTKTLQNYILKFIINRHKLTFPVKNFLFSLFCPNYNTQMNHLPFLLPDNYNFFFFQKISSLSSTNL